MLAELSDKLASYMTTGNFSLLLLCASFLGGVLSSISPCSIGMIPLVVGYVGGYGDKDKFKTFIQLTSFVFGLSVVLSVVGIICAITGNVFTSISGPYWIIILSSLILVMGLNLLGIIDINISPLVKRFPKGKSTSLFVYPFIIGALFAFATSPCSTPILASIMSVATLSKSLFMAGLMLLFFSLGQGLIVVLAGVFASFLKGIKSFSSVSEVLMKISGALLVVASLLIFVKVFSKFF